MREIALSGFLSRLRKDVRGNTLALVAAAVIPLCALAGSAIDIGRLYVVRTRLQTACDAGALAGRKFLDTTTAKAGDALDKSTTTSAGTQAKAYFDNNFGSSWAGGGWYSLGTTTFSPTVFADSDNTLQVQATASADVPMTIMAMFGMPTRTLNVSCQAAFNTPDADVMFVIDVTGSMSCTPTAATTCSGTATSFTLADGSTDYYNAEVSGSKLQAVRDAVSTFYSTLASNMPTGTHVRYGFVPYSSSVNVGQAIYSVNSAYINTTSPSTANCTGSTAGVVYPCYQTRMYAGDYQVSSTNTTSGTPTNSTDCNAITAANSRSPATGFDTSTGTYTTKSNPSWSTSQKKCTVTLITYGPKWTYNQYSPYSAGWASTVLPAYAATINGGTIDDPSKVTAATTSWPGCVEEWTQNNYNAVGSYDIDNLPPDMNPDYIPSSAAASPWWPMWPAAEYSRRDFGGTSSITQNGETGVTPDTSTNQPDNPNFIGTYERRGGWVACNQAAKRLGEMTATEVNTYTASLRAHGGTYHDTGMIWGLRMLSPQGIFAGDTAAWSGHADPKRVLVFLTDGAMSTSTQSYGMTGIEYYDKRVRGTKTDDLDNYHNARFLAECSKAQEKNIEVWVIAVGQSLTDPLKTCVGAAHPERAIYVNSSTNLSTTFKTIATAVSMLRVSQ